MSFLYPRTVTVQRVLPATPGSAGVGAQAYSSQVSDGLQTVGQYPASIQIAKEVGNQPAKLPTDAGRVTYWKVFVRAPLGSILGRDVLVDDMGLTYQVTAPYWNSMGYQCMAERTEL